MTYQKATRNRIPNITFLMCEDEIFHQAEDDETVRLNVQFFIEQLGKLFVMAIINEAATNFYGF